MADESQLKLIKEGVEAWNNWRLEHPEAEIDLSRANLYEAELYKANLINANLTGANLIGANLIEAKMMEANLMGAKLVGVCLIRADLNKAVLCDADLGESNLSSTDLSGADLSGTKIRASNLSGANLTGAILRGATLQNSILVRTKIDHATFTDCKVFGISAWELEGVPKNQSGLIITPNGDAEITVDDLQIAQFIYLLLNNRNVRNVIDTITSKAVLILGRFTPERKKILDLIREELRKHDYVPILFNFEKSESQSLLETVITLAGMARFVIADVTAATMVREELRSIVEKCPAKPIQPILLYGEKEYVTLPEMRISFRNILPTFAYKETSDVVSQLSECVIQPAEKWIEARKAQLVNGDNTDEVMALNKKIEALEKQLQTKSD